MRIVEVKLSEELNDVLRKIFAGCDLKYFGDYYGDEYLLGLLRYFARKIEQDSDGALKRELEELAIGVNNNIHYGMQLRSGNAIEVD